MERKEKAMYINDHHYKLQLVSVNYKTLEVEENEDAEIVLKTKDMHKIISVSSDEVKLQFKRQKFFEPEALMRMEIVLNISYDIEKEDNDKPDIRKIKKEVNERIEELLSPLAAYSSIIISTLTNISFPGAPVVDPPFPLSIKPKKKDSK